MIRLDEKNDKILELVNCLLNYLL